jgi:MerR family transcriptional regulator, thiopeptide resistance regulator
MNESYKVHQFAELAGVTVKALRHYDRIGLLQPRRSEAGYRLYQLDDLARLQQIVALKSLGLPLKDIRTLLNRRQGSIRSGLVKAWADRDHWPPALKRRVAEYDIERATQFIGEALWERWEAERLERERAGTIIPARASESRRALDRDWSSILGSDAVSPEAQAVVDRWHALLDAETGGDEETKREMLDAWSRRSQWPRGMKRYFASLYELDVDTWERVTDFLERAATIDVKHARGDDGPTASVE